MYSGTDLPLLNCIIILFASGKKSVIFTTCLHLMEESVLMTMKQCTNGIKMRSVL